MTAVTSLVAGNDPAPDLAERAAREAMEKMAGASVKSALLLLTPDFSRRARETVLAVSRATRCTQVLGGLASGVATEAGWVVDRPAAALLLLGGRFALTPALTLASPPLFSYSGQGNLPLPWQQGTHRFGLVFADGLNGRNPAAWSQGRIHPEALSQAGVLGGHVALGVSSGLKALGAPMVVTRATGYELETLGTVNAGEALRRILPMALQLQDPPPLHHVVALLHPGTVAGSPPGEPQIIPLLSSSLTETLTLAAPVTVGAELSWAIRQPLSTEQDMRRTLEDLSRRADHPAYGLMCSCIGRGPYFYGGEDRDLLAFREAFPGLPILGAYGSGQIAPAHSGSRLLTNSVVAAVVSPERAHVQSIA